MAMFKLECFTQAFAMNNFFFGVSSWYKYRNTITRRNEWRCKITMKKWVLQIFECAFLRRRRMAHNGAFFWRCFSEFFRKWSSSAVFPHAVSQVRGQLPHKSGDNPLPCHKKAVILHRNSKITARSSHVHRILTAHACTSKQQAHMVFPEDASRVLK